MIDFLFFMKFWNVGESTYEKLKGNVITLSKNRVMAVLKKNLNLNRFNSLHESAPC